MDVESVFRAGGLLASVLPRYEPRPGQMEMARAVEDVLRKGGVLLAEAGTGTGKTLAYLVPALLSGKKIVVSTATKTLQAQILEREVPLLAKAFGKPVSAVALKGRQNYLCLRRFQSFRTQPLFQFAADAALYERLERWAGATQTGDRADMDGLPDDYGPWRDVCSTTETCWGSKCPNESDCHLLRQRRAAHRAQIVVVNHHLFFADLAVKTASPGEVIPRYGAAVLDEAHQLEAVATQYFGVRVSSYRTSELVRDAMAFAGSGRQIPTPLANALHSVTERSEAFWAALPRVEAPVRLRGALEAESLRKHSLLLEALGHLGDRLAPRQAESLDAEHLFRRTKELEADLVLFASAPAPGEVRWLEPRGRGVFLQAAPVEVGSALAQTLFSTHTPVVLTSATLGLGGTFAYIRERLGIPEPAEELVVASPFDHTSQGLLYVPRSMPDPNDPSFPSRAAREIARLLRVSNGRAFCLFTSHRVLRAVAGALQDRLPYPLLVQGSAPREVLLRRFQEDVHSVLLGAQSFWEGVDVPGEALSAVIVDKIPFSNPTDPLVEARIEHLRARDESPFASYQLPAAAMALRQGLGRLIRRAGDRGLVAVLDRRVLEKSYGRFLRANLPPFPLTHDLSEVVAFFKRPPVP